MPTRHTFGANIGMKPKFRVIARELIASVCSISIVTSCVRALGGTPIISSLATAVAFGVLFTGCFHIGRWLADMILPAAQTPRGPDLYSEVMREIEHERRGA